MTVQTLYNKLNNGIITQSKFLYEVRKDGMLPMITKFNNFNDTINILKNKGIISEVKEKNPEIPEVDTKTIDTVSPYEYSKGINFELDLLDKSVGQNMPTQDEVNKAQKKVLDNLTKEPYYYTKKLMRDEEKKQEKSNLRPEELKKNMTAPNQMVKGKMLKENSRSKKEIIGDIVEEWGLTKYDMEDDDVIDEILAEYNKRVNGDIDEAIAVKDKAGNVQYAKDDSEANNIMNQARTKGVQMTKQNV